ncbi:MAG: UDP-N-acetylglucosamine 2-epimerase (non-hydrolyzing) [Rhodothermia bacterium]|nr:UDP-N-acetylglucosamine 2-epimerase (non-hydrolyzing) [Rhodothermia bacterium]
MKIGPIHRVMTENESLYPLLVHTGQHYDEKMSDIFFRQLEMPKPDVYLGVGSGSHAAQTARVMEAFDEVLTRENPDMVVVVGDVNSTLACSLVAVKRHIPVAHVEAGLRSFDRRMPEEINRIVTDSISDLLFVTEQSGVDNLEAEGVSGDKVFFVGNVMIDALVHFLPKAEATGIAAKLGVAGMDYTLMTMHRPSNVDNETSLRSLVTLIENVAALSPVIFPVHPRTGSRLDEFGLRERLDRIDSLQLIDPLGYLQFLGLMKDAKVVITDSGGIQEETTYLGVPCLTLRENTERPVTIELGTNELLSLDPVAVLDRFKAVRKGRAAGSRPPLWDGRAASRIVDVVSDYLA